MNEQSNQKPKIELLWWSGCPSHEKAFAMLADAVTKAGLEPADITRLQMVTMQEAERENFIGSPTIRINGADLVPPDDSDLPALTCRLYFKANGRPSPLPEQLLIEQTLAKNQ